MTTILVTGGAGFIGSCFVRQWIAEDRAALVNLDKLTYAGNLDSLGEMLDDPHHIFVEGDIADRRLVDQLLAQHRPQAVINFAAESHVDRSIDTPAPFVQTNVVGTFELLDAAYAYWQQCTDAEKTRFRFLHVSTDEVYGSLDSPGGFTETTRYAPNSPYSASKAAADHFVRAYHRTFGLPVLLTNCSNNYGPYQFPEKLIPLMILNALEGKPLPLYGDGQHVRDWLHVEDHCRGIDRVLKRGKPGEVYNIGASCEKTNREVVEAICAIVDRLVPDLPVRPSASLITQVADRPGHDRRYAIDTTKIRTQLGWQPQWTFESGLEQTVRWYLDHRDWVERINTGEHHRRRHGLANATTTKTSTTEAP